MFSRQFTIVLGLIFLLVASSAMADWVEADGHKMHWPQLPDVTGWDVNATYPASVLADDFRCGQTGPITDIHFWGSWKHDDIGTITGFWLSIHEDIPDPDGDGPLYSMPGITLWDGLIEDFIIATPVDPPGIEGWYDPITGEVIPSDHQNYFQYNVFLPEGQWIQQEEGRIYWLNISAVVLEPEFTQWGVKSTLVDLNHMDDAVYTPAGSLEWMEMYHPTSSGYPYVPGDVDGSGVVNMSDVLFLETFMGAGSPAPPYFIPGTNPRFYPAADVDGDCQTGTLADMAALIDVVEGVGTAAYCPAYPPMATDWGPSLDLAFVITGPDPVGACCYDDGSCTNGMTAADCVSSGGAYGGDGSSCSWDGNGNGVDDFCEGVVSMGACCYGDLAAPTCVNTTQTVCGQSYGGTWYLGQDCASFTCPSGATGACCYDDGSCEDGLTAADCVANGGDYGGDGTNCANADSDQNGIDDFCDDIVTLGACCYPDASGVGPDLCVNTTGTICGQSLGGTWYPGQDCATFTCPTAAVGACCYPDGTCAELTLAGCQGVNGLWMGADVPCAGDGDGNGVDDGCEDVFMLKWNQQPDLDETGMDVSAFNQPGYPPYVLADDFQCTEIGSIMEIHVFGSWYLDNLPLDDPHNVTFTLSIHEDIPADVPGGPGYSMPGDIVCLIENPAFEVMIFAEGLREGWLEPPDYYTPWPEGDEVCWEYIFYLDAGQCVQLGTVDEPRVYWLDVQAVAGAEGAFFGWKTSVEHWNDDAVWANGVDGSAAPLPWEELIYPPPHPFAPESIDLAFQIWGRASPAIGACCYEDGSCVDAMTAADCASSGGQYAGDGQACAGDGDGNGVDDLCEGVVTLGACCYGDPVAPTCVQTTATVCGQTYNGTWYPGQDCASFTCPTAAVGACCYDDGSCVDGMTAADCASSGGQYAGDGQTCAGDGNFNGVDDACEGIVTLGACCYLNQVAGQYECMNTTLTYCGQTLLGDWNAGQDCASYQCAYPGACCYEDAAGWHCAMTATQGDCDALSGTWYEGVPCAAIYCTGPTGACCYGDPMAPSCANTTEDECNTAYSGTWYAGEDCASFTCPEGMELKWFQAPDLSPEGMDVNGTFSPISQYVLATDFECTSPGSILEIHVFGSWYHDYLPFGGDPHGVGFTLSIHTDIPDPDGDGPLYSMPGEMMCFYPDFTEFEVVMHAADLQEGWLNPPDDYDPFGDEICWEYIFQLPYGDCIQEGTPSNPIVYWLDVQARPFDEQALWGWKTAEPPHWNDDAVWAIGVDDPGSPLNWNELITPGGGYDYVPGDVDGDGDVDNDDVDYLTAFVFVQGPAPVYSVPGTDPPFYAAADCNGDCNPALGVQDVTALADAVAGGTPPLYCDNYPPSAPGVSLDLAFAIYGEVSADTCAGQIPGDFDGDGFPGTTSDLAGLTAHVLGGGPPAVPASNGDFNGDCRVNSWDVADMTSYIATGLPTPADCTCLDPYGPCCHGVVGNANLDPLEQVTIGDIAVLTNHLFIDRPPLECVTESDVNQSGGPNPSQVNPGSDITIGDVALLTDYLFITGPEFYGPLLDCF